MKIDISVIIPVYNKSEYIERCVQSLLAQKKQEFEVVFVDDGSADDSAEICAKIAEKDARFKVITQKNKGVAVARNTGIKAACGKYLAFIDPDDTVKDSFLSELFEQAERENSQITCCGYTAERKNGSEDFLPTADKKEDIPIKLVEEHPIYNSMCTKMYLREFIIENNILVPAGIVIGEDSLFNLLAYALAEKTAIVQKPLYNYIVCETSAMQTKNDRENRLKFIEKKCEIVNSLGLMDKGYEILARHIYENGGNVRKTLKNTETKNKTLKFEVDLGIYPLHKKAQEIEFRLKRKLRTLIGRRK